LAVLDARKTPRSIWVARSDIPHLSIPDFPSISRQVKQVQHLKRNDWDRLMSKIVALFDGASKPELSVQQYKLLGDD
jgi:hypothetical protein